MAECGVQTIEEMGIAGCVELTNGPTRVVLDPHLGGRVLVYSLAGENVLHVDPEADHQEGYSGYYPTGGRCDIGPEMITCPHPELWRGAWQARVTGDMCVTLTSPVCEATGVQLQRRFSLADDASHLMFTQVINNVSERVQRYCHWGRTFLQGGGICLIPLNPHSRYPAGYILYGPGDVMDYRPEAHPNVHIEGDLMAIVGPQERSKYIMDTTTGWLAYLTLNNRLFVKTFGIFPGRIYGEMAAATASVWYNGEQMCEIEPIGPLEAIEPGKSVSFTENWWLFEYPFPEDKSHDFVALRQRIERWL